MHKFILAARTPYFHKKLTAQPGTSSWNLSNAIPSEAFQIALRYVYLGNVPRELVSSNSNVTEEEVVKGLDKISKQLGIDQLWEAILAGNDRRLARHRYQDEVDRARKQVETFFKTNVLGHKMIVDSDRVDEVKWKADNSIFADVLLRADRPASEDDESQNREAIRDRVEQGIPVGPSSSHASTNSPGPKESRKSVLYPAHKAMLIRSEYFETMFSGEFLESRQSENLHIIKVDCSPEILELILTFIYTESTDGISLDHALDLLYAADMLFLDPLKNKAAIAISTLGSGSSNVHITQDPKAENAQVEVEPVNIYDVIHAAWDLRVQRLEEFAARYLADRLEDYVDEEDFQELIRESADRLRSREETDTIELLDDIRYYLSERFRLRFEDTGLDEVMDGNGEISAQAAATIADAAATGNQANGAVDHGPGAEGQAQDAVGPATVEGSDTDDDEFASDAINYQILLGKIDSMLDRLKLDA